MLQSPRTPRRPAAQNLLPPSPRRKRLRNHHPSRSPPRLRGSKDYRRRAPRPRHALTSFTQDASPAVGPNDSPDASHEITNPSSPLDRYNPTRKTAYKQLMIDFAPSPTKRLSSPTSGDHAQSIHTAKRSGRQWKATSVPKHVKLAPPEEVDDGVFFSSDPAPSRLFSWLSCLPRNNLCRPCDYLCFKPQEETSIHNTTTVVCTGRGCSRPAVSILSIPTRHDR